MKNIKYKKLISGITGVGILSSLLVLVSCGSARTISYDEAKNIVDNMYNFVVTDHADVDNSFSSLYQNTNSSFVNDENHIKTSKIVGYASSLKDLYVHTLLRNRTFRERDSELVSETYIEKWSYIRDNQFFKAISIKTSEGIQNQYKVSTYDSAAMREIQSRIIETSSESRHTLDQATRLYRDEFYDTSEFRYDKSYSLSYQSQNNTELVAYIKGYTNNNSDEETFHYSYVDINNLLLNQYTGTVRSFKYTPDPDNESNTQTSAAVISFTYTFKYQNINLVYPDLTNFTKVSDL